MLPQIPDPIDATTPQERVSRPASMGFVFAINVIWPWILFLADEENSDSEVFKVFGSFQVIFWLMLFSLWKGRSWARFALLAFSLWNVFANAVTQNPWPRDHPEWVGVDTIIYLGNICWLCLPSVSRFYRGQKS